MATKDNTSSGSAPKQTVRSGEELRELSNARAAVVREARANGTYTPGNTYDVTDSYAYLAMGEKEYNKYALNKKNSIQYQLAADYLRNGVMNKADTMKFMNMANGYAKDDNGKILEWDEESGKMKETGDSWSDAWLEMANVFSDIHDSDLRFSALEDYRSLISNRDALTREKKNRENEYNSAMTTLNPGASSARPFANGFDFRNMSSFDYNRLGKYGHHLGEQLQDVQARYDANEAAIAAKEEEIFQLFAPQDVKDARQRLTDNKYIPGVNEELKLSDDELVNNWLKEWGFETRKFNNEDRFVEYLTAGAGLVKEDLTGLVGTMGRGLEEASEEAGRVREATSFASVNPTVTEDRWNKETPVRVIGGEAIPSLTEIEQDKAYAQNLDEKGILENGWISGEMYLASKANKWANIVTDTNAELDSLRDSLAELDRAADSAGFDDIGELARQRDELTAKIKQKEKDAKDAQEIADMYGGSRASLEYAFRNGDGYDFWHVFDQMSWDFGDKARDEIREANKGASKLMQQFGQATTTAVQIGFDTAVSALTGGVIDPKVVMALRVFGSTSQHASRKGASTDKSIIYGALNAGIEYFTESMFGLAGGLIYGKGFADDFAKQFIHRMELSPFWEAVLGAAADVPGEALEEGASAILGIVPEMILNYDKDKSFKENFRNIKADQLADIWYEMFMGGFIALLGTPAGAITGQYSSNVGQQYNADVERDEAARAKLDEEYRQRVNTTRKNLGEDANLSGIQQLMNEKAKLQDEKDSRATKIFNKLTSYQINEAAGAEVVPTEALTDEEFKIAVAAGWVDKADRAKYTSGSSAEIEEAPAAEGGAHVHSRLKKGDDKTPKVIEDSPLNRMQRLTERISRVAQKLGYGNKANKDEAYRNATGKTIEQANAEADAESWQDAHANETNVKGGDEARYDLANYDQVGLNKLWKSHELTSGQYAEAMVQRGFWSEATARSFLSTARQNGASAEERKRNLGKFTIGQNNAQNALQGQGSSGGTPVATETAEEVKPDVKLAEQSVTDQQESGIIEEQKGAVNNGETGAQETVQRVQPTEVQADNSRGERKTSSFEPGRTGENGFVDARYVSRAPVFTGDRAKELSIAWQEAAEYTEKLGGRVLEPDEVDKKASPEMLAAKDAIEKNFGVPVTFYTGISAKTGFVDLDTPDAGIFISCDSTEDFAISLAHELSHVQWRRNGDGISRRSVVAKALIDARVSKEEAISLMYDILKDYGTDYIDYSGTQEEWDAMSDADRVKELTNYAFKDEAIEDIYEEVCNYLFTKDALFTSEYESFKDVADKLTDALVKNGIFTQSELDALNKISRDFEDNSGKLAAAQVTNDGESSVTYGDRKRRSHLSAAWQHNPNNLPGVEPRTETERSAYTRAYINATNGMQPGETKIVVVRTGSNAYLVEADGAIPGLILHKGAANDPLIQKYTEEIRNAISGWGQTTGKGNVSTWSNGRRNIDDDVNSRNKGTEKANASMAAPQPGSYESGDASEIDRDFWDRPQDEVEADIDSGVMPMSDNHVSKYGNRVVKESSPQGSGVTGKQSESAATRKQTARGEEKAVRDSGGTTYVSKTNEERSRIADHQLREENFDNEINRLLSKDERWDDQDVVTAERAMYKMIRSIRDYQLGNSRKMKKSAFDALIRRYNDLTTRHINEKSKAGQELQATYEFTPEELVMNRMAKTFLGFAKDGTFAGNSSLAVNAKIYAAAEDAANRITKAAEDKNAYALAQICKDISDIRGVKHMFGVASGFASKVENEILNAIAEQENGVEALQTLALGNLNAICDDVQPYKVVNAAKTIRVMNMLSNMSTIINNITNNIASGMTSTNALAQGSSLLASKAFENIIGQPVLTPAAKGWVANKEIRTAEMEALKMATLVQMYGVNQENGRLELSGDRGLFNPNANAFEQTMAMYKFFVGMGVEATDQVKSEGLKKAMNIGIDKALAKGKLTEKQAEAMRKEAEHEVRRLLYKDDNRLSGLAQAARNRLNKALHWGNDDIGTIGLGDIAMAFAKVPANVVRARLYATPEGCLLQLAQYTKGVMKAKRMHSETMARQIMESHAAELANLRSELQKAYDLEAREVSQETKDAKIEEIKNKIAALNRECWNEAREKCSGSVYNKLTKMRDNYGSNLDFDDCVQRCKYSDATEMSQFEAATYSRKIGKAATSAGMVALGAILRSLGALRDFDQEPDDELRKMYAQKGYKGLMFNWSAIGRENHEWRDGDIVLGADFLEVIAMPLAIGACAQECSMNVEGKGKAKAFVTEAGTSGLSKTFEAVGDIPGMADAVNLYNAITSQFNTDNKAKGNRVLNAGIEYFANTLPSFFIPNAYTQLGAGLDNTVRDVYTTDNIWQQAGNIILNKTAYFRKKIPASVDMWGEERTYGEDKFWGVVNKTILPGDRIRYRQNKYESEIIRLTKAGYKSAVPKLSVSGSFEIGDETYTLDADEKRAFRQNRNTAQAEVYRAFMDSPEYDMLTDDQKVAVLKDLKMDCERDAKQAMLIDRGLDVEVTRAKWETELTTTKAQITYLSMAQIAKAAWDGDANKVGDYAAMDAFIKNNYPNMTEEMRSILGNSLSHIDNIYDASKYNIGSQMWQTAYDIYQSYAGDEGKARVEGGYKDWEAAEMLTKIQAATNATSQQMEFFKKDMMLWNQQPVTPDKYNDLVDKHNLDRTVATSLTKHIAELQPSNGNKTVSYKQRLRQVAEEPGMTDDQRWEVFYEYCPVSYTNIIKGMTDLRNRGYEYEQALKTYKSGKNSMWWVYENEK